MESRVNAPEETVREKKKQSREEKKKKDRAQGKRRKVEEKIGQWDEGVIKQERGCEAEQPVGDGVGGLCKAGNTEQWPGGMFR